MGRRSTMPEGMESVIVKLVEAGWTDKAIGEKLCQPPSRIRSWRTQLRILKPLSPDWFRGFP